LAQKVSVKAEIIDYIKSTHRLDIIGKV